MCFGTEGWSYIRKQEISTLTQYYVRDDEGEDEDGEEGEWEDEQVEEAIVPPPHAVAHPRAVMIKSLWGETHRQENHMLTLLYMMLTII